MPLVGIHRGLTFLLRCISSLREVSVLTIDLGETAELQDNKT